MSIAKATDGRFRILLIDQDGLASYQDLASPLDRWEVAVANDPHTGRELFMAKTIDLVILEHTTETSRAKLLHFFQTFNPSVPVIITTASGSEELAVRAFRCGATDYFRKPIEMDEFTSRIREILGIRNDSRKEKPVYHSQSLEKAVDYISRNLTRRMKLANVAREAGMSTSCFTRLFKGEMEETFIPFVNNLRIAKSLNMLEKDHLSMSEIAFECGFANQYHFSRTFKKLTSTSPSGYRTRMRSCNQENIPYLPILKSIYAEKKNLPGISSPKIKKSPTPPKKFAA